MCVNRKGLIFVVDDEPAVIEVLSVGLVDAGFRVKQFSNGRAALDFAQVQEPDAVISDVHMPQLDGFSLARQIRNRYPRCKVLLMSGAATSERDFKVLQKPVSLAALLRALAKKTE